MIAISIESVGRVEVLALSTQVTGRATVLVDLGTGFRDRYVTWTLARKNISVCTGCGRRIENVLGQRGWYDQSARGFCSSDPTVLHDPASPNGSKHEYHAHNGHYHSQRWNAELDFEKRAGFRATEQRAGYEVPRS